MNWNGYLRAAVEAGLKAGGMLQNHFEHPRKIIYKGAVNLVTDHDERSQKIIFESLSSLYPGHDFLSEEDLSRERGSDFRWIIDPIDGTTNYAHKLPFFCVSIALEWRGDVVLGIVFDPIREELFSAVAGQGAMCNKRKIHVSGVDDLDKSLLATGFPYDLRESEQNNLDHFANFALRAQAVRRCGSAALDLCYLACGRFDGFWEMKLSPWDMAAGVLIVKEAGGRVSDFKGDRFDLFGSELLATNNLIHSQMIAVLRRAETLKTRQRKI